MKKIGEVKPIKAPTMIFYYDEKASANPYRVYLEWYESKQDGYGLKHCKRLIVKYADLLSCVCKLQEYVRGYNEDRRK